MGVPINSKVVFSPFSLGGCAGMGVMSRVTKLGLRPNRLLLFGIRHGGSSRIVAKGAPRRNGSCVNCECLAVKDGPDSFTVAAGGGIGARGKCCVASDIFTCNSVPSCSLFSNVKG